MCKKWIVTFSKSKGAGTFENGKVDFEKWLKTEPLTGKDQDGIFFAYNQKNQKICKGGKIIFAFTNKDKNQDNKWLYAQAIFDSNCVEDKVTGYKCVYYVKELNVVKNTPITFTEFKKRYGYSLSSKLNMFPMEIDNSQYTDILEMLKERY
jgi:hypothetical protein